MLASRPSLPVRLAVHAQVMIKQLQTQRTEALTKCDQAMAKAKSVGAAGWRVGGWAPHEASLCAHLGCLIVLILLQHQQQPVCTPHSRRRRPPAVPTVRPGDQAESEAAAAVRTKVERLHATIDQLHAFREGILAELLAMQVRPAQATLRRAGAAHAGHNTCACTWWGRVFLLFFGGGRGGRGDTSGCWSLWLHRHPVRTACVFCRLFSPITPPTRRGAEGLLQRRKAGPDAAVGARQGAGRHPQGEREGGGGVA